MKLEKMRIIDLKKELKQRGLKGYSSLKKAQLIAYLSTGIHPLKADTDSQPLQENEIQDPPIDGSTYSPTILSGKK